MAPLILSDNWAPDLLALRDHQHLQIADSGRNSGWLEWPLSGPLGHNLERQSSHGGYTSHLQSEDGTYTGFIKVHLKLRRPVTVPAGIRPQSIYDAIKEVNPAATTDKRTSFYLPLDAIKQLHISSTTTVSEVIQGLLKKFMVVDNPQKFALFKRIHKDGQGTSSPNLPQSASAHTLA